MAVKFSEFAIGTIDADLELVGFDSATPENVQVSYSDIKTDILADAQSPLNGIGFVKISGTTITYDNSTYLTGNQSITLSGAVTGSGATSIVTTLANSIVGIANINATGTPSNTTFLRGDGQWATPTGGAAIISIGSSITSSTVGSVLFVGAGGVLQQDNANFFWDDANNRLGVGINAPTSGFHLLGTQTIQTLTQAITFNNRYISGSDGRNIFLGGGGASLTGGGGTTSSYNNSFGYQALLGLTTGYFNHAFGFEALLTLTTGTNNAAFGMRTLKFVSTGSDNVAVGSDALRQNTNGANTAIGSQSLRTNTSGNYLTAVGLESLRDNTSGIYSTALGAQSLLSNTTGNNNTAIGLQAGWGSGSNSNTTGSNNIFIGYQSVGASATESNRTWIGNASTTSTWLGGNLLVGTTTDNGLQRLQVNGDALINTLRLGRGNGNQQANVAFGFEALNSINTQGGSVAIGNQALKSQTSGGSNTAIGSGALALLTGSVANVAVGAGALALFTGNSSTAVGTEAAASVTTASNIVAIGRSAFRLGIASNNVMIGTQTGQSLSNASASGNTLVGNDLGNFSTTMSNCTALGYQAINNNTTGNNNIGIGFQAGQTNSSGSNNIFIGVSINPVANTDSNRTFIGNDTTATTWLGGNLLLGSKTDNATDRIQVTGSALITGVLKQTVTTNRQVISYSLVLSDRGKLVEMNVATANNLTVPLNSSIAFPIGTQIDIAQYGAGQTTVVATSGVTVRSASGGLKLAVQYSGGSLVKIGTDEWYLFGDITV